MSPRPRSISDADLIAAAGNVLAERTVHQLRLSDVAAVTQLAPATLVQRFGSRDGLLDALAAALIGEVRAAFAPSGTDPLESLAVALHRLDAQRQISFFVARPAQGSAYSLELRKHIGLSLLSAIEAGDLVHCDVAQHARRIQITFLGMAAAALLEGSALELDAVRAAIEESLADYR